MDERMTVYRLMEWLSQHSAGREVRVSVLNAEGLNDITGMEYDEFGPIILGVGAVEIEDDEEDTEDA